MALRNVGFGSTDQCCSNHLNDGCGRSVKSKDHVSVRTMMEPLKVDSLQTTSAVMKTADVSLRLERGSITDK